MANPPPPFGTMVCGVVVCGVWCVGLWFSGLWFSGLWCGGVWFLGAQVNTPPTVTMVTNNRQPPPTTNRQLLPTASGDQPPTANFSVCFFFWSASLHVSSCAHVNTNMAQLQGYVQRKAAAKAHKVSEHNKKHGFSPPKSRRPRNVKLSEALRDHTSVFDGTKIKVVEKCIVEIDHVPNKFAGIETLFLSNNFLTSLEGVAQFLNLRVLSAANNSIAYFVDLDPLSYLPNLAILNLEYNPVTQLPNYRYHVLRRAPSLRNLDNKEVTKSEWQNCEYMLQKEDRMLNMMYSNRCLVQKLEMGVQKIRLHEELRHIVPCRHHLQAALDCGPPAPHSSFDVQIFLRLCHENFMTHQDPAAIAHSLRKEVRKARNEKIFLAGKRMTNSAGGAPVAIVGGNESWDAAFNEVMLQQQNRIAELLTKIEESCKQPQSFNLAEICTSNAQPSAQHVAEAGEAQRSSGRRASGTGITANTGSSRQSMPSAARHSNLRQSRPALPKRGASAPHAANTGSTGIASRNPRPRVDHSPEPRPHPAPQLTQQHTSEDPDRHSVGHQPQASSGVQARPSARPSAGDVPAAGAGLRKYLDTTLDASSASHVEHVPSRIPHNPYHTDLHRGREDQPALASTGNVGPVPKDCASAYSRLPSFEEDEERDALHARLQKLQQDAELRSSNERQLQLMNQQLATRLEQMEREKAREAAQQQQDIATLKQEIAQMMAAQRTGMQGNPQHFTSQHPRATDVDMRAVLSQNAELRQRLGALESEMANREPSAVLDAADEVLNMTSTSSFASDAEPLMPQRDFESMQQRRILRRTFAHWYRAWCMMGAIAAEHESEMRRAAKVYEGSLLQRCFRRWALYVKGYCHNLEFRAQDFHKRKAEKLMGSYYAQWQSTWASMSHARDANAEVSHKLLDIRAKDRSIKAWTRSLDDTPRPLLPHRNGDVPPVNAVQTIGPSSVQGPPHNDQRYPHSVDAFHAVIADYAHRAQRRRVHRCFRAWIKFTHVSRRHTQSKSCMHAMQRKLKKNALRQMFGVWKERCHYHWYLEEAEQRIAAKRALAEKRLAMQRWMHTFLRSIRTQHQAMCAQQTQLQQTMDVHKNRLTDVDIENVRLIDHIHCLSKENTRLNAEIKRLESELAGLAHTMEDGVIIEGAVRREVETLKLQNAEQEAEIRSLKQQMHQRHDDQAALYAQHMLLVNKYDQQVKQLTDAGQQAQQQVVQAHEEVRQMKKAHEASCVESNTKLTSALQIAAALRKLVEHTETEMSELEHAKAQQHQKLGDYESRFLNTTGRLAKGIDEKSALIRDLLQKLHTLQTHINTGEGKLTEYQQLLQDKDEHIAHLERELGLLAAREAEHTNNYVRSIHAVQTVSSSNPQYTASANSPVPGARAGASSDPHACPSPSEPFSSVEPATSVSSAPAAAVPSQPAALEETADASEATLDRAPAAEDQCSPALNEGLQPHSQGPKEETAGQQVTGNAPPAPGISGAGAPGTPLAGRAASSNAGSEWQSDGDDVQRLPLHIDQLMSLTDVVGATLHNPTLPTQDMRPPAHPKDRRPPAPLCPPRTSYPMILPRSAQDADASPQGVAEHRVSQALSQGLGPKDGAHGLLARGGLEVANPGLEILGAYSHKPMPAAPLTRATEHMAPGLFQSGSVHQTRPAIRSHSHTPPLHMSRAHNAIISAPVQREGCTAPDATSAAEPSLASSQTALASLSMSSSSSFLSSLPPPGNLHSPAGHVSHRSPLADSGVQAPVPGYLQSNVHTSMNDQIKALEESLQQRLGF